jgi:hypothetical protein
MTELTDYRLIANNKIQKGYYYAQSFSLKEKSADVANGFKQIDPTVDVIRYDFWADAPFYRYLNGESTWRGPNAHNRTARGSAANRPGRFFSASD